MKTIHTIYMNFAKRLVMVLAVGLMAINAWGTTIASWGKISISASTDYKATGGDANNNNVAKFSSSKAISTGAGTNSYYGSGAGGAVITFSNLNLSTYTSIQMTFYSRASSGGSIMLSYSMDGSSWVDINSATVNGTESQKTITGIPYYATYLRLTHSASSGSLYFGTVVISGTAATMRTVTWNVNGSTTTAGSPTVSVPSGSKVGKLPTVPSSCDGSKVFVGWTATPIVGTTNTEPADLFGVYLDAPTVSANTDYYAVFATATPGSDTNREYSFLNSSAMSTSTSAGWSVSPTTASYDATYGANWGRNSGAILPVFTFTPSKRISKITITVRQSNTTGSNTVSCSAGGTTINTLSMPNDKASHDLEFSPSFASKGTIVIRCTNTSANSTGQGTLYVKTIILKEDATTYSAYATSCASCSDDPTVTAASNNGSITSTSIPVQCASGISDIGGTGCSLTSYGFVWNTTGSPNIDDDDSYEVGTSIDEDEEFEYLIEGLTPNTTYYIRPYATNGNGTGYGDAYTVTTLQRYTISYNSNGGSGTMSGSTKDHGVAFALPANAGSMTKTGYHIKQWRLNSAGGTAYPLSGSYTTDANATFYVDWEANTYTVTLNGNGATGAGSPSTVTATYNSNTLSSAITNPTKTDYIFGGWNTKDDGTGLTVIDASGNLVASQSGYTDASKNWIKDGGVTLYAKWTEHTYTNYRTSCCDYKVTFTQNDPENGTIVFSHSSLTTCGATDGERQRTMTITPAAGYKLKTFEVATGDGKVAASSTIPDVAVDEDNSDAQVITLTFAQYAEGNYDVTATFEQMHDEYYDYMHDNAKVEGNRIGIYSAPTRSSKTATTGADCKENHYKFKGWVVSDEVNEDGTLKSGYVLITSGTSMTASNKIYYAVWTEEE